MTTVSELTKITVHPDVIEAQLGNDETVLLHLGNQSYYSLNATGTFIWRLMAQDRTIEEIRQALEVRYEVEPDRARQCILDLTTELAAQQLVSLNPDSQGA